MIPASRSHGSRIAHRWSLQMLARQQAIDHYRCANQRERHERESYLRSAEVFRGCSADLCADGRPSVHHQRDHYIDVALDRVGERPVARGDNNFEQVGPDRHVSWNAEQIDHRRHSYVACAAAEEPAEHPSNKRHQQDRPQRDALDARHPQLYHRRKLDTMNLPRNVLKGRLVFLRPQLSDAYAGHLGLALPVALHLDCLPALPRDESGDGNQHDNEGDAYNLIDVGLSEVLEPLDALGTHLNTCYRSNHHDEAQLQIYVSKRAVLLRGDDGFADNVSQIGADYKVHRNSHGEQRRSCKKASANAEEPSENADDEPDDHEIERTYVRLGNKEIHRYSSVRTSPNESQQDGGHRLEHDALPYDQQQCGKRVTDLVMLVKRVQPVAHERDHKKDINYNQTGVQHKLDQE